MKSYTKSGFRTSIVLHSLTLASIIGFSYFQSKQTPYPINVKPIQLTVEKPYEKLNATFFTKVKEEVYHPEEYLPTTEQLLISLEDILINFQTKTEEENFSDLEEKIITATEIPKANKEELKDYLDNQLPTTNRNFDPIKLVEDHIPSDNISPYYRRTTEDGIAYLEILGVEKNGDYVILDKKPISEADSQELSTLRLFETTQKSPFIKFLREKAMGIILDQER